MDKYIKCNDDKAPLHNFDITYSLSEVHECDNLAVLIEEPYVVVDIDDDTEFDIVLRIVKDLNIKTRILKTHRGGHFWFKSLQPLTNVVHSNTPLTVKIDIKSWGKKTMEVVKHKGVWRTWLQQDETVDELPFFLKPIKCSKDIIGMTDGDGRNNALFTYILPLINEKLTKDEIQTTFYLINQYVFQQPLHTREIDAMLDKNDIFDKPSMLFYNGSSFQHNVFADYMISEYNMKSYCEEVYFYNGSCYQTDKELVKAKMVQILPMLKKTQLEEVYENIRYKLLSNPVKINKQFINVKNGLYNLGNGMLMKHTPEIFTINQLNCSYIPGIKCDIVDKTLDNVCCHNENLKMLLKELMGYCLLPDCRLQKSFILLGNGSNGKSLFLEMIRTFMDDSNCSSLALEDLSATFRTAELVGKMVNIGDDSAQSLLENTAIFKKLVTGDSITIERKHQLPFKFVNSAKLLFALNALPPTLDKSDGFFRRCIIVPFNARFSPKDKDYDMNLIDKVTTADARSYLFSLALEGLKKLLEDRHFIETDEINDARDHYELSNNNVLMWLTVTEAEFPTLTDAYSSYVAFCAKNNYKPVNLNKFQSEITKKTK